MPAIIPIPAFADNCIWLVRDGGAVAVVDPGDAAPVIAHISAKAEEHATNPFLRTGEATLRAAAERRAGRALVGPVGVFAELRAWRNSF